MGLLGGLGALIWSLIFGTGGLAFIFLFLTRRGDMWWAAIPGFTLLGLMMVILVSEVIPGLDAIAGPIFLAAIGMGLCQRFCDDAAQLVGLDPRRLSRDALGSGRCG